MFLILAIGHAIGAVYFYSSTNSINEPQACLTIASLVAAVVYLFYWIRYRQTDTKSQLPAQKWVWALLVMAGAYGLVAILLAFGPAPDVSNSARGIRFASGVAEWGASFMVGVIPIALSFGFERLLVDD